MSDNKFDAIEHLRGIKSNMENEPTKECEFVIGGSRVKYRNLDTRLGVLVKIKEKRHAK